MSVTEQIEKYLAGQAEPKQTDLLQLHQIILQLSPKCRLWFHDGKDENGKTVSNPNVGYGFYTIKYANGTTKEFFRIGLSATSTGISVYILGIEDKKYLAETFGGKLGKAKVTGYCISFKSLKDINLDTLKEAVAFGLSLNDN